MPWLFCVPHDDYIFPCRADLVISNELWKKDKSLSTCNHGFGYQFYKRLVYAVLNLANRTWKVHFCTWLIKLEAWRRLDKDYTSQPILSCDHSLPRYLSTLGSRHFEWNYPSMALCCDYTIKNLDYVCKCAWNYLKQRHFWANVSLAMQYRCFKSEGLASPF